MDWVIRWGWEVKQDRFILCVPYKVAGYLSSSHYVVDGELLSITSTTKEVFQDCLCKYDGNQ